MNLHICTISCRNDFLNEIYDSIFQLNIKNVIWHISREIGNPVIIKNEALNNVNVKIYNNLYCEKTDTSVKMDYIFQQIINTDSNSYFCILDDDTLFHQGMYNLFLKYNTFQDKKFMVIGKQIDKNNLVRLHGTLPYECAIDSGNVLCHSHVLQVEKWEPFHWDDNKHVDFEFWNRCFKHFGITATDIVTDIVSIYNKFSDKKDSLNYLR